MSKNQKRLKKELIKKKRELKNKRKRSQTKRNNFNLIISLINYLFYLTLCIIINVKFNYKMKYKFHSQIKPSLVTLLIFLSISFISAENMKAQVKVLNKRLRVDDYYERPIIIPNQHYHHDNRRRIQGPPNIFRQQENTQILPLIRNRPQNMYQPIENCPCINEVKCPPCGVVFEPSSSICPCAPKPNCPVCPPLSLIHEIAAKKVITLLKQGKTRSNIYF